ALSVGRDALSRGLLDTSKEYGGVSALYEWAENTAAAPESTITALYELLIASGATARLNSLSLHGYWSGTPLKTAIRYNNSTAFRLLLSHPSIDLNAAHGFSSPIVVAAYDARADFVDALTARFWEIDFYITDYSGRNALTHANRLSASPDAERIQKSVNAAMKVHLPAYHAA